MSDGVGSESLHILKLATTMIMIGSLLVFVVYSTGLGKNIGDKMYDKMVDTDIETSHAQLSVLTQEEYEILPTAAVYALTQYSANSIFDVTCYICDPVHGKCIPSGKESCLVNHLHGKVKCTTKYDEALGQYHLYVNPYSYIIKFNANGGDGHMADQEFIYDTTIGHTMPQQELSENMFCKTGFEFAGWSLTKGGGIIYSNKQKVKNLIICGDITLYAVWK